MSRLMRSPLRLMWLATILLSCGPAAELGQEGGACRFGIPACDDGLTCLAGACVGADEAPAPQLGEESFSAVLTVEKYTLEPDGMDTAIFQVELTRRSDGAPYSGEVLLRTHPLEGANILPARIKLEGGKGAARIRSCNQMYDRCPAKFRIVVARVELPTEPIAQTVELTNRGIVGVSSGGGTVDGGETVDGVDEELGVLSDTRPPSCKPGLTTYTLQAPRLGLQTFEAPTDLLQGGDNFTARAVLSDRQSAVASIEATLRFSLAEDVKPLTSFDSESIEVYLRPDNGDIEDQGAVVCSSRWSTEPTLSRHAKMALRETGVVRQTGRESDPPLRGFEMTIWGTAILKCFDATEVHGRGVVDFCMNAQGWLPEPSPPPP